MGNDDTAARAREGRAARTELRQALGRGEIAVDGILDGTDQASEQAALGMKIGDIIAAHPGTRDKTIGIALAGGLLHMNHRLRDLTTTARRAMADYIRQETT